MRLGIASVLVGCLLWGGGNAAGQEAGGRDAWWLDVREEGRARFAQGKEPTGKDIDFRLLADGAFADGTDRFAARFAAGMWLDCDGIPDAEEFTPVQSLHDDSALDADVFSLYGDYRPGGSAGRRSFVQLARVGRQVAEYGLPVTFDGAGLVLGPVPRYVDLFAFGGRTVHFFESSEGLFEDWMGSGGVAVRPMPGLKLVADYRWEREAIDKQRQAAGDEMAPEDALVRADAAAHAYGLAAWYNPAEWLYVRGYGRGLGDSFSHAGGAAMLSAWRLGMEVSADWQLVRLGEVSESLNPYFAILGESLPSVRWSADLFGSVETGAGEVSVHGGCAGRQVTGGEEKPFNRNAARAYLVAGVSDLVVSGPFVTVIGEAWLPSLGADIGGEGYLTLGGSAGWKGEGFRAEAGTSYQRFKYEYYKEAEEVLDVRSWYGEVSVDLLAWLSAEARYELEQFDWDVHTVVVGLSQKL